MRKLLLAGFGVLIALLASPISSAQTCSNCPAYTQQVTTNNIIDKGMANDAVADVQIYNTGNGNWSPTAIDSIETAIDSINAIPGSDQDATYNGTLKAGTTANPQVIIEYAPQTTINSSCPPKIINGVSTQNTACTSWTVDSTGTRTSALILVLTGTTDDVIGALITHEYAVHADYGWNDCSGTNCSNSISDNTISTSSPTAPTCCDVAQAKICGR
jgi:hypothetical protein